ncbi:AAWKG family protein [Streptomyces sp. NPDC102274]|uniref:AAWKG family protein n=1 Tax=Streptomyces sp. NPDC102274 TaxID=3366151 RepID=UPI003803072E
MPDSVGSDDYWSQAVNLFTGYPMPERAHLFEKISSDEGIPLFRMDIRKEKLRAITEEEFSTISGWGKSSGEDYDLAFYGSDAGPLLIKVRIVFIGVPSDGKGRARLHDEGEISSGSPFKGPSSGIEWDSSAMAQYISGPKVALDKFVNYHTTRGVAWSGATIPDSDAVDLKSFERTARAFDRAAMFFVDHGKTVAAWEKQLGSEQAAWKGKAAGVFWHLIHQVNKNYESYVEQLGGAKYRSSHTTVDGYTPGSRYGDSLALAQRQLYNRGVNLLNAWDRWADSGLHDPHRWLLMVLDDLGRWLLGNNVLQVAENGATYAGFQQLHPIYGDLSKLENWKKVGDEAVRFWNQHVDNWLTPVAAQAISTLKSNWIDDGANFDETLTTKDTSTLSAAYNNEQNEIDRDKANEDQQNLNDILNKNGRNANDLNENLKDGLGNLGKNLNQGLGGIGDGLNNNLNNLGKNLGGVGDGLNNLGKNLNQSLGGIGDGLDNGLTDLTGGSGGSLNNPDLTQGGLGNDGLVPSTLFSSGGPLNTGLGNLNEPWNDGNSGPNSLTNPDGSNTRLNSDGSLTTLFPDGSQSTFNPSTGTMTTTSSGGKNSVLDLGGGRKLTNPDGSTTVLNNDGSLTTTYPDGSTTTVDPSTGSVLTTDPDGSTTQSLLNPHVGTFSTPGGGTGVLNSDGSLSTTYPDGTNETINPATHTVTTTSPDVTVHTSHLDPGGRFTNPDGSVTTLNDDGSLTTKFPDGTVQTVTSDGTLQTTRPDGTTSTTQLNSGLGSDLTSGLGLDGGTGYGDFSLPDLQNSFGSLPHDSPLNTESGLFGSPGISDQGGGDLPSYDEFDDTPFTGGTLGGPSGTGGGGTDSSAASAGMPLNPGLAGMGGMGGMGGGPGGGSGSANGERVRTVHGDSDGADLRKRRKPLGGQDEEEEEEDDVIVGPRPMATTGTGISPAPGESTQQGRSTESAKRPRASYVVKKDEDVWGSDSNGAPAAIG